MISPPRHRRVRAFTLIELLVVAGIIALLVAILVPVVASAMRSGERAKSFADISALSTALNSYKTDHGYYPPVPVDAAGDGQNTGFAVLCKALVGPFGIDDVSMTEPIDGAMPGDAVDTGSAIFISTRFNVALAAGMPWIKFDPRDGLDGTGFMSRRVGTGAGSQRGGKFGPYLNIERFKIRGTAIVDNAGMPYLYYVGGPKVNVRRGPGAIDAAMRTGVFNGYIEDSLANCNKSYWNPFQNWWAFVDTPSGSNSWPTAMTTAALAEFRMMMGDYNNNGVVDAGEPVVSGDFILWGAGPDTEYGVPGTVSTSNSAANRKTASQSDDVTSFNDVTIHAKG